MAVNRAAKKAAHLDLGSMEKDTTRIVESDSGTSSDLASYMQTFGGVKVRLEGTLSNDADAQGGSLHNVLTGPVSLMAKGVWQFIKSHNKTETFSVKIAGESEIKGTNLSEAKIGLLFDRVERLTLMKVDSPIQGIPSSAEPGVIEGFARKPDEQL